MKFGLIKNRNYKTIKNFSVFRKRNLVWFIVFILLSLNVFFAIQTSSMGVSISLYEDEINKLENAKEELSIKLIDSTSLTKLSQVSEELGFMRIENMLYLQQGDSFAKVQ
jgi:capsule polysaccharide export protein KpsE/RkpR